MRQHADDAKADDGTSGTTGSAEAPRPGWVPIRSLAPRHRERIVDHLLELDGQDRYLRFGHQATDEQIRRYGDTLDFERDELFGIFNRRLHLIAMAHLAHGTASSSAEKNLAEFGVSVLARARGRGYGARLFRHAALHARNRGCDRLLIHALSENRAMLKIAVRAGARVGQAGSESEAWLSLPAQDRESQVNELVEAKAAEWNYRFKVQARRLKRWMGDVRKAGVHFGRKNPKNRDP
jgi:GNAT superfamily N-acetyltransferase